MTRGTLDDLLGGAGSLKIRLLRRTGAGVKKVTSQLEG